MTMPTGVNPREYAKFRESAALTGQTVVAVTVVDQASDATHGTWVEGTTKASLTTGNNDGTFVLTKGTVQSIKRIVVSAPGAIGTLTTIFYSGAAPTTPISGTLYLAAGGQGFNLGGRAVAGTLGYRIAGWTGGNTDAFITVEYNY